MRLRSKEICVPMCGAPSELKWWTLARRRVRDKFSRMLIHSIRDDAAMVEFGVATKLNPDWDFLCRLRDSGRAKAAEWLEGDLDKVGRSSTVDLADVFL